MGRPRSATGPHSGLSKPLESVAKPRHIVAIVNPACPEAGKAEQALRARVRTVLPEASLCVLFTSISDPGQGLAHEALGAGADAIVVAGGDGTVRAVASAALRSDTALGIIALGTANLVARNLRLPLPQRRHCASRIEAAIDVALGSHAARIDVGVARFGTTPQSHEIFLVVAGLGHDGHAVRTTSPRLKRRMGWVAYLVAGARHLRSRPIPFQLSGEDGRERELVAWTILVGNLGALPWGIRVIPQAKADDGVLDTLVVSPRTPLAWIGIALGGLVRRHDRTPGLSYSRVRRLGIQTGRPQWLQLDGEAVALVDSIHVAVDPAALLIKVPQRRAGLRSTPAAH